ncbi:MAG: DEAD/DEAH box helicase [Acidobacteria bacterium]|nr:DEAD/DEAH box helicase [Acidobacteriota bacterium]
MTVNDRSASYFSDQTFDEFDLPEPIRRAVDELGFTNLTRVQAEVLPFSLAGRDVVAQAQTGSGKTAAYLLTIFTHLLRNPRPSPPETPRALIVAPTRELAVQIAGDAEGLGHHAGIRTHVVFGGLDYRKQREILERGTDLLVGTPGRLIDYHRKGSYSLRKTEMVVIDECDRLFDMGFAEDLRWILRRMPHPTERQSMMFTATLSQRVMTLGWRQMNDPVEAVVSADQLTPDTIHQELYHVATREKLSLLLGLLQREGSSRTMVFVNTRYQAQRLVDDLQRHGFTARGLTGNVVQTKRLKVLDDFRDGKLPILVATDVASRGLHIEGVSHVINYDLPQDPEDYVHRIGRTARVGAEGRALTLACEDYVYSLDAIQWFVGYELPTAFADDSLYAEVRPRERRPRTSAPRSGRPHYGRSSERHQDPSPYDAEKPRKRRRRRRPRSKPGTPSDGNRSTNE